MKERPILFNDEMVRALFDGKSQTRRPCNVEPEADLFDVFEGSALFRLPKGIAKEAKHRFGQPGDKLWVRECFHCYDEMAGKYDLLQRRGVGAFFTEKAWRDATIYRADCSQYEPLKPVSDWTPSVHMPRWASRTALDVLSVKVERVQDITEADAEAEGMLMVDNRPPNASSRDVFADVFDAIYGAGAFRSNPWVWRVDFERART
jgi:hypothetical protein